MESSASFHSHYCADQESINTSVSMTVCPNDIVLGNEVEIVLDGHSDSDGSQGSFNVNRTSSIDSHVEPHKVL